MEFKQRVGLVVILTSLLGGGSAAAEYAQGEPPATNETSVPGWPLKVGASMWARYEVRENYDRLGVSRGRFREGDFAVYRARLSLKTSPIDLGGGQKVTLQFSPQADGFWGDQPSTVSNPNLGVYEAFVRLENDWVRLDVGHFSLNYGDALVIGDLRWHQTARSFDGGRARIFLDDGPTWIDLFVTQLDEGLFGPDPDFLAGDSFFIGAYASLGSLVSDSMTLEPYVLAQIWTQQDQAENPATGEAIDRGAAVQTTIGLRALQPIGIVDVRVEAGIQLGRRRVNFSENPEVLAFQVDGEIGIKPAKGFRISLEGLYASGDDPATADTLEGYDELFPTTHKFLGLADVIGIRTNIASGVLHLKYAGVPDWVFKLDQHIFARPRTTDGQRGYAGTETDINVIYKIAKGMTGRVMYCAFVPGSRHFLVDGSAVDDLLHYVEVQYGYAF